MLEEIKERFESEGVVIPFNQLDVNLKEHKGESEEEKVR